MPDILGPLSWCVFCDCARPAPEHLLDLQVYFRLGFGQEMQCAMMSELENLPPAGKLPISWLIPHLLSRGICGKELCARLKLDQAHLFAEDATVNVENYLRLIEWASRHVDDPDLGLKIGVEAESNKFGLLGYLATNASTVRDFCVFVDRYYKVFSSSFDMQFEELDSLCSLDYFAEPLAGSETRQDIDFTLSLLATEIRRNVGPDWRPEYCSFTYTKPDDLNELRRYFGPDLRFEQDANRMVFSRTTLRAEMHGADANLLKICRQLGEILIKKSDGQSPFSQDVRIVLSSLIGKKQLSADIVSKALNLTVRSMHRELRNEGTSFRTLRKTILHQAAQEILDASNAPVSDIALYLGYSETSAFNRAFKREEGLSPLQYRRRKPLAFATA